MKSQLEFSLRIQEFAMLVVSDQSNEAIDYAKKHLAKFAQADPD